MKKFLLISLFVLCAYFNSSAQEYIYCEIVGTETGVAKQLTGIGKSKITIEVDFGNVQGTFKDNRLRGEDGKPIKFNSMVDAMNWMGTQGWEFCQAYIVTMDKQNVYHWLLKLNVSHLSEEERNSILGSLKTKEDFKK